MTMIIFMEKEATTEKVSWAVNTFRIFKASLYTTEAKKK